jgi:hypothetical protein
MSDIEGKAATVAARKCGQRTSFKTPPYRGKAKVDLQNQFVGAACNFKRSPQLLAQQSSRTDRSQNPVRKNDF